MGENVRVREVSENFEDLKGFDRNMESNTSVLCQCIFSFSSLLLRFGSGSHASNWREYARCVPTALHCRQLITALPSKISPAQH